MGPHNCRTGLRMWVVLASVTLMSPVLAMMPKLESSCETVANRIHITKEEFSKAKELMRTCEEDIELMKCEGSCVSSTMPSAMDRSGFSILSVLQRNWI